MNFLSMLLLPMISLSSSVHTSSKDIKYEGWDKLNINANAKHIVHNHITLEEYKEEYVNSHHKIIEYVKWAVQLIRNSMNLDDYTSIRSYSFISSSQEMIFVISKKIIFILFYDQTNKKIEIDAITCCNYSYTMLSYACSDYVSANILKSEIKVMLRE